MSAREDVEAAVYYTDAGLRSVAAALASYALGDVVNGVALMKHASAHMMLASALAVRAAKAEQGDGEEAHR